MRWRQVTYGATLYFGVNSRALASTPLYSNTTMALFLPTIYSGGYVSLMGKFDVEGWLKRAQAETITHTMLVPVQYRRLMQYPHFDRYDLSALQMKRSEEHTSELQSLMRISYAVFCLKKKKSYQTQH